LAESPGGEASAGWRAAPRGRPGILSCTPCRRRAAAALLLLPFALACAGGPSPRPLPSPTLSPWEIPQGAYGSQRLYRVSYSGPEGEGSFKVTLRLATPVRYQIQAVDPVGRALWSLDVAHDEGLWLNHRSRTYCTFEGRFDLSGAPLGPFPLLSLPSLLIGRVPAEPAGPAESPAEDQVSFRDASGRLWTTVVRGDGVVESWVLTEGKTPQVWWMRRESWAILSDRERQVQVRWREVLREDLDREPPALETPAGYRQVPCGDPDLPEDEGDEEPP
jgi:hypothetical protein